MNTKVEAIRRVAAYRTTDGKTHETRVEAQRHQAKLELIDWLGSSSRWAKVEDYHAAELAEDLIAGADDVTRLLRAARKGL